MNIIYKTGKIDEYGKIVSLYEDAGWTSYTKDKEMLYKAYENSFCIISAWDENELVGIIRAVGDGYSILYIQDIIVRSTYQNQGIGSNLFQKMNDSYSHVYQKVLLTDNEDKTVSFYKKNGFSSSDEMGCISFVKYTR